MYARSFKRHISRFDNDRRVFCYESTLGRGVRVEAASLRICYSLPLVRKRGPVSRGYVLKCIPPVPVFLCRNETENETVKWPGNVRRVVRRPPPVSALRGCVRGANGSVGHAEMHYLERSNDDTWARGRDVGFRRERFFFAPLEAAGSGAGTPSR